jgi:hypothetical protein
MPSKNIKPVIRSEARPGDYPLRVEFCEWLLRRHRIDLRFIQNILWTDESYFSQEGIFNQHNNHITRKWS